jgi:lysophospholipase L1-like esterase
MRSKGVPGTVVNGGTGGYTSNQELLKLIRDGLELRPDIVISYSGVNDRGFYGELPYPMVHTYQRQLLNAKTEARPAAFLPSTIALLQRLFPQQADVGPNYTLGLGTERSLAEQYVRNMELMNLVSSFENARFFGFIQPCAFCNGENASEGSKSDEYMAATRKLYNELLPLASRLGFLRDATRALHGLDDAYQEDGVHLTPKGDKAIANYIYAEIAPALRSGDGV